MRTTLALRFAAAEQSWGIGNFHRRLTASVPTRSGVVGHLAAALGAHRGQLPPWLHTLSIFVRVDSPGRLRTDFHTVNPPIDKLIAQRTNIQRLSNLTTEGDPVLNNKYVANFVVPNGGGGAWAAGNVPSTLVSGRDYLVGAEFIVAISGSEDQTAQLASATRTPAFMTYLGRKSCAPRFPYHLGRRDGTPMEVLSTLPTIGGRDRPLLPVHKISEDHNPAIEYVNPPRAADISAWSTP